LETAPDLPKRQSRELAETYAEKMTLQKSDFARKNEPGKKPEPNLLKLLLKKCN
jgi:hypothetical protein